MILAAGLGTRLKPLTSRIPKALVKVNGMTLLEIAIRKLSGEGFSDIIINVHHHAGQIIDLLKSDFYPNLNIAISDESGQLLDTGGAIRKAKWFLDGDEPFLVHNVDVISDISLDLLMKKHLENDKLATLSVMDRKSKRYMLFDQSLRLSGWKNISTGEVRWAGKPIPGARQLAFSGIHVISPKIFTLMENTEKFSVIDTYLRLAAEHPIYGQVYEGTAWFDLGKPEQIDLVSNYIQEHPELIRIS
jgi:NDP-sugar pyrophosphorylase family protein